jgi:two-component system, OmpR family, sensor kinase
VGDDRGARLEAGRPCGPAPRFFARFAAGPDSRGLGLGLYLARGIAEAHGGTVALDGTGPTGTTFQLALPADGPR